MKEFKENLENQSKQYHEDAIARDKQADDYIAKAAEWRESAKKSLDMAAEIDRIRIAAYGE